MEMITLTLITKEPDVQVDLNPKHLSMLVDGAKFLKDKAKCTQVTMMNGEKFFVSESVDTIKQLLRDWREG